MEIPSNIEFFETTITTFWLNPDGILYSVSKMGERKVEHYEEIVELFKHLIETKGIGKFCLLADAKNMVQQNSEVRDYFIRELPKYIKANAVLSENPLDASLTNTFVGLSWNGFPIRMFNNEREAVTWLKEYM